MKVEIFTPVIYYGSPDSRPGWPPIARLFESDRGLLSISRGFEQCEAAFEAGFDSLNLAEHHYSTSQMTPAPHLFAAALGQGLAPAQAAGFGPAPPRPQPGHAP